MQVKLTWGMQCGLSGSENRFKMQDDLALLFSRNLTIGNTAPPSVNSASSQVQAEALPVEPITYITQHYHHSAHVVPFTESLQNTSISPATPDIDHASPAAILAQNNIDPSSLFPSQLTLFHLADADQRHRLIQLWRISPPSYGAHALAQELGNWPPTSLTQEEEMAQIRYARNLSEQVKLQDENKSKMMEQDCGANKLGWQDVNVRPHAEPYILSGYETLARQEYDPHAPEQREVDGMFDNSPAQQAMDGHRYAQATDPVHRGQQWWHNFVGNQTMEHQYGAFDQMNRFEPQSSGMAGRQVAEDEEML